MITADELLKLLEGTPVECGGLYNELNRRDVFQAVVDRKQATGQQLIYIITGDRANNWKRKYLHKLRAEHQVPKLTHGGGERYGPFSIQDVLFYYDNWNKEKEVVQVNPEFDYGAAVQLELEHMEAQRQGASPHQVTCWLLSRFDSAREVRDYYKAKRHEVTKGYPQYYDQQEFSSEEEDYQVALWKVLESRGELEPLRKERKDVQTA